MNNEFNEWVESREPHKRFKAIIKYGKQQIKHGKVQDFDSEINEALDRNSIHTYFAFWLYSQDNLSIDVMAQPGNLLMLVGAYNNDADNEGFKIHGFELRRFYSWLNAMLLIGGGGKDALSRLMDYKGFLDELKRALVTYDPTLEMDIRTDEEI